LPTERVIGLKRAVDMDGNVQAMIDLVMHLIQGSERIANDTLRGFATSHTATMAFTYYRVEQRQSYNRLSKAEIFYMYGYTLTIHLLVHNAILSNLGG